MTICCVCSNQRARYFDIFTYIIYNIYLLHLNLNYLIILHKYINKIYHLFKIYIFLLIKLFTNLTNFMLKCQSDWRPCCNQPGVILIERGDSLFCKIFLRIDFVALYFIGDVESVRARSYSISQ